MTRRAALGAALAAVVALDVGTAPAQTAPFRTLVYSSGSLRIQGYLYLPQGPGPFPVILYNHGSREGEERTPVPFRYVGVPLSQAGYAVFVPERRGYGASDGPTYTEAVGRDVGAKFIARMRAETDDVLAAASFLATVPGVDVTHMGVMGWSLGGIVTVFACARTDAFRGAVDQAGGALTWTHSPELRAALVESARGIQTPVLFMDAENDTTTDAVTTLANILHAANRPEQVKIYPAFHPSPAASALAQQQGIALGHLIFGIEGISLWSGDVISFLDHYVK